MLRRPISAAWIPAAVLIMALLPVGVISSHATPSVAERFAAYYASHQGMRVLGYPLTGLVEVGGYPSQYFEKGRIEDHRGKVGDPNWQFMFGRLTAELMQDQPGLSVSSTNLTYGELITANEPRFRVAPPPGFTGGTKAVDDGMFIPYDPFLRPAPGYVIAPYFWAYINRTDLFPGGWLHDIGLPMSHVFEVRVIRDGMERYIIMQAFERAVLTYDIRNPAEWQVEKGNIGADAMRTFPFPPPQATPTPDATASELPVEGTRVILPVHILLRKGTPGEQVNAILIWQDGTRLSNQFTVLRGEDGKGLVIGNLDWINMLAPPQPATQPATFELQTTSGVVLARRQLTVVGQNDPNTQEIKLYWTVSGNDEIVVPQYRRIIKTSQPGTVALQELLWGPPRFSQIGYGTALPTPEQVLSYPGRQPDWGPRVTLKSLRIEGGVATADFSREMQAYGGGSLRVKLIRDQITQTLKQFPSVREVLIAVEGQTEGVLEP